MNKKLLYTLIASMSVISVTAYADPVADDNNTALTTKGYVDTGLKYVYDSIKGDVTDVEGDITNIQGDITDLQTAIGTEGTGNTPGTGLTGDIEALQDTIGTATVGNEPGTGLIGDVEELQGALSDGNGDLINVGTLKQTVDGLSANSAIDGANTGVRISNKKIQLDVGNAANTTYVYKTDNTGTGSWQALEVESSWNPTAFENNVLNGGN